MDRHLIRYRRPGRARAFVVLALVLALLAACGGDEEPEEVDPAQLLEEAAARTEQLESFHFLLEHERGTTQIVRGLQMVRAEGDVAGPDELQLAVDAAFGSLNVRVDIIVLGEQSWITNPLTGRWESEQISLEQIFDPATGVTALMRAVADPRLEGTEAVDGVESHRVAATVDSGDVRLFGQPAPGQSLQATAWIGVEDRLVRRIEVVGPLAAGEPADLVRRLTLSNFDADVEIEPPR